MALSFNSNYRTCWRTRDGNHKSPVDMTDSHLLNVARQIAQEVKISAPHHYDSGHPVRGMSTDDVLWFQESPGPEDSIIETKMPLDMYEVFHAYYYPSWIIVATELHRRKVVPTSGYEIVIKYLLPPNEFYIREALKILEYPYPVPRYTHYWEKQTWASTLPAKLIQN